MDRHRRINSQKKTRTRDHMTSASAPTADAAASAILHLQRNAGNAATAKLLAARRVQADRGRRNNASLEPIIRRNAAGDLATHSQEKWDRLEDLRLAQEVARFGLHREGGRFLFDGGLVYRGDSRPPREIFTTGFRQQSLIDSLEITSDDLREDPEFEKLRDLMQLDPNHPRTVRAVNRQRALLVDKYSPYFASGTVVSGEKVLGGISTTVRAEMARSYGHGGFVYAITLRGGGFDFTDVSKNLEEVNAVNIDPEDVIAAVGPMRDTHDYTDGGRWGETDTGDWEAGELHLNPNSTADTSITTTALEKLQEGLTFAAGRRTKDDSFL